MNVSHLRLVVGHRTGEGKDSRVRVRVQVTGHVETSVSIRVTGMTHWTSENSFISIYGLRI